jgi:membrane associated rhomboid family serine protease
MAAEFPRYRTTQMLQHVEPIESDYFTIGPKGLFKWVISRDSQRQFSAEFLILWGARYLPNMTGGHGFWRWFTMPLLHQSFSHVFSNMLLSLFVAGYLERKYGSLRTLMVAFAALLTSSFLSAALEDSCAVIVGASGVVFGLGAMYICDMVFNFSTCTYPFVRLLGVLLFLVMFIITLTYASATSHIAHLGGVAGGLIFSLLIQPSLQWELLEAFTPFVAMVWAILTLVCLPLYIYGSVLKTGVDQCVEVSGTVTIFG